MVCLFLVEHFKYLGSRRGLIGLRPESVSIVEDNPCFALAIKLPHRLLDLVQFVVAQCWQGGLNFSDSTHEHYYTSEDACKLFIFDGRVWFSSGDTVGGQMHRLAEVDDDGRGLLAVVSLDPNQRATRPTSQRFWSYRQCTASAR